LLGIFQEALAANDQLLSVGDGHPFSHLQKVVSESGSRRTQERDCKHVCFEGYAGGCSPGTTAPLSIENTSGAIHKVIPTFDVCLENLVLEIFVLDVPKSAIFALRYPSLYSSEGTPVRAFTKMFEDLTSRCTMRLLCKYCWPERPAAVFR
jgi:hypothetical protein